MRKRQARSKVIVSPLCASSNTCRRVPEPLSAVLLTIMILPSGGSVDLGVGTPGVAAGPVHDITRRSIAIAAGVTSLTNFNFVLPFPRVCCVDLSSGNVNYSLTNHIILLFAG